MSSRNLRFCELNLKEVTRRVNNEGKRSEKTHAKKGFPPDRPGPYKIAASAPFDCGAKNLTPYGGLFPVATTFTNHVGALAESEGHHPAILTEWGRVTVTLWTHTIQGLHRNDFIMAAKIDSPATAPGAGTAEH